jgi:dihydropteroate synthase
VTPDSFSDGGKHCSVDLALRFAQAAWQAGAAILDVGGESTRPGAKPIWEGDEIARLELHVLGDGARDFHALSLSCLNAHVARALVRQGHHLAAAELLTAVAKALDDPRQARRLRWQAIPALWRTGRYRMLFAALWE